MMSIEEIASPEPGERRARKAIKELAERKPALLEAPIAYFKVYQQEFESTEHVLQRTPAFHFALTQCFLSFREICTKLQKRTLKAIILRENMGNLIALVNVFGKEHPEISEPVVDQIKKFIVIIEDLDCELAKLSNIVIINWTNVTNALQATAAAHKLLIDTRPFTSFIPSIEDFVVNKILGRGAFGAVYRATFRNELQVAIKLIPQSKFRADGKNDSSLVDKLVGSVIQNHPFICRILCAFVASSKSRVSAHSGVAVTVMEALDGSDIAELLNHTSFSYGMVQSIMMQLMMAVEHMHLSGFLHRDLKPANMIFTREGFIKLIDFDVSKACIRLSGTQHQLTYFARTAEEFAEGEKAGTEAYMAPEVHQSKAFGRASDWWSVGVVYFRLVYGRLPFRSQNIAEEIKTQDINWSKLHFVISDVPPENCLESFISKLLIKEPKERLGSKDYAELFEHPLFSEANWLQLPDEVELPADCEHIFNKKKTAASERNSVLIDKAPRKENTLAMEDLIDYTGEHYPLLTFSSKIIKRLVNLDTTTTESGLSEVDEPCRWRHYSELKKIADDTTGGTTTQDEKKDLKEPVEVILQEYVSKNGLFGFGKKSRPIRFQRLMCEDGMYRFLVSEIAPNAKIIGEAKLYHGDLVMAIDKSSLVNLSEANVDNLLSKKGSPLVLSVARNNIFREISESTLKVASLLYKYKLLKIEMRVQKNRKNTPCLGRRRQVNHGIKLAIRKVFSTGLAEPICIVDSHDLTKQFCTSENNVFSGDVVLSINETRLERILRRQDLEEKLHALVSKQQIVLELLPSSPLRLEGLPRDQVD